MGITKTYTQLALEMVIAGNVLILERRAKDQLDGGKYFAPKEQQKLIGKNVPTTNNVSEWDFGVLDILVHMKPAATDHAYKTYIMWLHNKPSKEVAWGNEPAGENFSAQERFEEWFLLQTTLDTWQMDIRKKDDWYLCTLMSLI